jgi:hypothetical protein
VLRTIAQQNRLLDESIGALEWAARKRKCEGHRLAPSEPAILREDVSRPTVERSIACVEVEETAETQDGKPPPDVLAASDERRDFVTIGARVGAGDRRNPGARSGSRRYPLSAPEGPH